jgi:lipid A disaccharide synthetase
MWTKFCDKIYIINKYLIKYTVQNIINFIYYRQTWKNLIQSVLRRDKLAERGNQRIEKNVYDIVNSWSPSEENVEHFFSKVRSQLN